MGENEEAELAKQEGNAHFKQKHYLQALSLYSKAIELNPKKAIYYGNRSLTHMKLGSYSSALDDASMALSLNDTYFKGYYRRAVAYMAMGKLKLALRDFKTLTKIYPECADTKAKYRKCLELYDATICENKIIQNVNHLKDKIDYKSIVVDINYAGPFWFGSAQITEDFVTQLIETFKVGGRLHIRFAYKILFDVFELFRTLPSLVDVTIGAQERITVCGDIHGQFFDLLNIFELNGRPSPTNPYLFNGDIVDRGKYSVECIFTLFSYKLLYPDKFFITRGNHETLALNRLYGFVDEVKSKYCEEILDVLSEVYSVLPLAHCINERVLVVHGGLFANRGVKLDDIRVVNRYRDPPNYGIMCDLLWSDPQTEFGRTLNKRGQGIQFGPDVTHEFLKENKLDYLIRSHEMKQEGYEVAHDGKCITVFSAPNYFGGRGNKGAVAIISGNTLKPEFLSYKAVPQPVISLTNSSPEKKKNKKTKYKQI